MYKKKKFKVITGKFKKQYLLWKPAQVSGNCDQKNQSVFKFSFFHVVCVTLDLLTFLGYNFLHFDMGLPSSDLGKITLQFKKK